MPDYQELYHILFNEITRAIEQLQRAQQKTEERYIDSDDPPVIVLKKEKEIKK